MSAGASAPRELKSLRGNPVKQVRLTVIAGMGAPKRVQYVEWVGDASRLYNPKRDRRRQLMQQLGLRGGRQWKKLRRALRGAGEKV
jgi:hypothetical protein